MDTRKSARVFVLGFILEGVVLSVPVLAEQKHGQDSKP